MLRVVERSQPPPSMYSSLETSRLVALAPFLDFLCTPSSLSSPICVLRDSPTKSFQVGALGAGRRLGGGSRADRRQAGRDDEANGEDGGGEEGEVPGAGQVGGGR